MTPEEKQISFYNRYFIFRKNRNINAKQLKSSFLSYAGLQEEQDRAAAAGGGEEDIAALEKIAKASRPMDVASKPAIAAHIIAQRDAEKQMEAITGDTGQKAPSPSSTLKIKPKPKPKTSTTVKATAAKAAASAAAAEEEVSSAPIAQIEKKIQKRTKKVKITEEEPAASGGPAAAADTAAAPKRQTKKKTDL